MRNTLLVLAAVALATPPVRAHAQQIERKSLLKRELPAGDYRTVEAVELTLPPGAGAPAHRHDVGVVAYVLEGEVENRFNGGAPQVARVGESWWEAPGTVHNTARNASATARARLLIVYVADPAKANAVLIDTARKPPGPMQ